MPSNRQAAVQYRREAARVRALADASYMPDVRNELFTIAEDYEIMAQQREEVSPRLEFGRDESTTTDSGRAARAIPNPRRQSVRSR